MRVVITRKSKVRGRATSSREAVGGGANLKANEAEVEIKKECTRWWGWPRPSRAGPRAEKAAVEVISILKRPTSYIEVKMMKAPTEGRQAVCKVDANKIVNGPKLSYLS